MYHLFAGDNYYPQAGLGDYLGPYQDEEAAMAAVENSEYMYDWACIVILQQGWLMVLSKYRKGQGWQ